ncbi:hypothetical protein CLOHAE12215_01397 [Clostridium haemolyticum]|uniref:FxLYD domain-containing protein n=1 Tax=Clostridium haemolyticum TaxID=84025 RepID=UPI001C3BF842|nr:FxLYD domain-containing protein [Clostridium haemolyticum]CAG7839981.1 hypothetical protein CLOHAE12215_01397 [Clostridium haemolyticum]
MKGKKTTIAIIVASLCLIIGGVYFNKNYRFTCFDSKQTYKKESIQDLNRYLLDAVISRDSKLCEKFLTRGANPNIPLSDGDNIFYKALLGGDEEICECLVKHGADATTIHPHPKTIYDNKTVRLFRKYNVKGTVDTLDTVLPINKSNVSENDKMNGFKLLEHHGGEYITGKVKNISGKNYSSVYININILDMKGNVVNSTLDNISNLKANQVWSFKAPALVQGEYKYEIMGIDAY